MENFIKAFNTNKKAWFFTADDKGVNKSIMYNWYGEYNFEQLKAINVQGAGIFTVINELREGGSRIDADIIRIRAVFIDQDDGLMPEKWVIQPSIIVKRNNLRKWHAYWFVTDCKVDEFKAIMQKLATYYKSDVHVCNPSRVMRVPGFFNHKKEPDFVSMPFCDTSLKNTVQQIKDAHGLSEISVTNTIISKNLTDEPRPGYNFSGTDEQLVDKLLNQEINPYSFKDKDKIAFKSLWNCDADALGEKFTSHKVGEKFNASDADMSLANKLAYWTGGHGLRIERLMRKSAMMRPKWDKHKTYLNDTIVNACNFITDYPGKCVSDNFYDDVTSRTDGDAVEYAYTCGDYLATLNKAAYADLKNKLGAKYGTLLNKHELDKSRRAVIKANEDAIKNENLSKLEPGTIVLNKKKHSEIGDIIIHKLYNNNIITYGEETYKYIGNCYEKFEKAEFKANVSTFIRNCADSVDGNLINPSKSLLSEVREAIQDSSFVSAKQSMPFWRNDGPEPECIIPFKNTLIDISNGDIKTISHTSEWIDVSVRDYNYEPNALCPVWDATLASIFEGDDEAVEALHKMIGYLLTHDTSQQKIFMLHGVPRSGKSTILRVIQQLIGRGNYCNPDINKMADTFGLEEMVGKQLAIFSDAHLSHRVDSTVILGVLKAISGEDSVSVHRKHKSSLSMKLHTRLLMAMNELPRFADNSGALAARLISFNFTKSFIGKEDEQLSEKLECELSGIINKVLKVLKNTKLIQPESGKNCVAELKMMSSPLREFIDERTIDNGEINVDDLYRVYQTWCHNSGSRCSDVRSFGRQLLTAGDGKISKVRRRINEERTYVYLGISIPKPEILKK